MLRISKLLERLRRCLKHCLSISCLSCKIPLKHRFISFIFLNLYLRVQRKHKVTYWEEYNKHIAKKDQFWTWGFLFLAHRVLFTDLLTPTAWFPNQKQWEIMISSLCFLVENFFSVCYSTLALAEITIKLRWNMPYATVLIVRPFSSMYV